MEFKKTVYEGTFGAEVEEEKKVWINPAQLIQGDETNPPGYGGPQPRFYLDGFEENKNGFDLMQAYQENAEQPGNMYENKEWMNFMIAKHKPPLMGRSLGSQMVDSTERDLANPFVGS